MKWVPAPLWFDAAGARPRLGPRVPRCVSALLSLAMLPLTILQLQALFGFGERPFRADYLVFVWAAVPWWWQLDDPFAFLRPRAWVEAPRFQAARLARWTRAFRQAPGTVTRATVRSGPRGGTPLPRAGRTARHARSQRGASITPVAADAVERAPG